MNAVQALVEKSSVPPFDVTGLLETYSKLVPRSREERKKLKSRLQSATQKVVDIRNMFDYDEAWDSNTKLPSVAIASIKDSVVDFKAEYRRGEAPGVGAAAVASKAAFTSKNGEVNIGCPLGAAITNRQARSVFGYSVDVMSTAYAYPTIRSAKASIPLIPRELMPLNPFVRRRLFVLFDTPSWSDEKIEMVDPYLLERVDKNKFRVLGHWDLTENERKLMSLISKD